MNMDTRKELLELYWDKEMSIRQIAEYLGVAKSTVHQQMNKFGIRTRTKKKAEQNYLKKNKLGRYKGK